MTRSLKNAAPSLIRLPGHDGHNPGKLERDVGRRLLELLDTDLAKLGRAS